MESVRVGDELLLDVDGALVFRVWWSRCIASAGGFGITESTWSEG